MVEGAASLGKSQPSVSRTLALLEASIGEPLFDRTRRPLKPSKLCETLAAQGRRVVAAIGLSDLRIALRDETTAPLRRKFAEFTKTAFAALEDTILHAERKALWLGGD
ncbi:MAG: LysR family transcriptional regulator [Tabrizicola sp.]|nr:LysR family transcriptional regulator [Tabrizicola sp.]